MTAKDAKPSRDEAVHALKQASRAAKRGEAAEAARWSKLAEQMAQSARTLLSIPEPPRDEVALEAMREELRTRLTVIAESDAGLTRWEMQRDMWIEMAAAAAATGCPPPPPLPPKPYDWTDEVPEEVRRQMHPEAMDEERERQATYEALKGLVERAGGKMVAR